MLNQAAHDIYNAAAEATGIRPFNGIQNTASHYLAHALGHLQFFMRIDKNFDIWIKAVEDLTRISRAERGA